MTTLGELTKPKVDQLGPPDAGEFVYVDISSVDNKSKRILEPKRLGVEAAPSRARQRLKAGDVLVSMTRPNLNAVAIVPPDLDGAIGSTGFHVLRANENVLPNWLYYGVQSRSFIEAMSGVVQGALYPAVRPRDIQSFDLPAPDVDEQRRIVAEIEKQFSRLDEAVANLQRVKANLKRYRNAVLASALSGDICNSPSEVMDAVGKVVEQHGETPEMAPDISLPPTWSWVRADEISAVIASGSTPKPADMRAGAGDVPFIKVYNLTFDGALDFTIKPTFIAEATHNGLLARSRCKPGDVLMNIVGPPLGKISIVPNDFPEWNINQAVVTFRVNERVLNRLLAYWLMSPAVRKRVERTSKATAGQFNVQVSTCRRLVLPLPPLAEQHRIVAEIDRRLSIVSEVEGEVEANLRRATRMRHSILETLISCS